MKLGENNKKSLFSPDFASAIRLIFLLGLAAVLLFVDVTSDRLDPFKRLVRNVAYPFIVLADFPAQVGRAMQTGLEDRGQLRATIERLEQENLILKSQTQRMATLQAENDRLRSLMQSSSSLIQNVTIAEIMAVDFDPYRHQVSLNRGKVDGVFAGQALLAQEGIVGQVKTAFRNHSLSVLITDPSHTVPVQVDRNGLRALLQGRGQFKALSLETVPNFEDIRVGDELVTSGLGGQFPRGYPVATVTAVNFDPASPFAQIEAKPKAKLDRLLEVLLVVNEQNLDVGESVVGPFKAP